MGYMDAQRLNILVGQYFVLTIFLASTLAKDETDKTGLEIQLLHLLILRLRLRFLTTLSNCYSSFRFSLQ